MKNQEKMTKRYTYLSNNVYNKKSYFIQYALILNEETC